MAEAKTTTKTETSSTRKRRTTAEKPVEEQVVEEVENVEEPVVEPEVEEVEEVVDEPLTKDTEVEVESLIANVQYTDVDTNITWEWDEVGDVETMTFGEIEIMHKKHKSYFNNLYLMPLDKRVIDKLRLAGNYDKYEYLINVDNYTHENIEHVIDEIKTAKSDIKLSIVRRITNMVSSGEITDVRVIMRLEKRLGVDFTSLL